MRSILSLGLFLGLCTDALAAQGNVAYNAFKRHEITKNRVLEEHRKILPRQPVTRRQSGYGSPSPYLNSNTTKFVVNGSSLPEVGFDVGESYAGLLPISDDPNETRQLFFWFFPSTQPNPTDEITIWLNGGPGCSSLSGLLTENGPFLWQAGTLGPTANSYSWNNLTNMLWVEQPVGVGYSQGTPNITNEQELGQQFIGFYKQFVDAFGTHGSDVYVTGESYAGYYVPYIADAFIGAQDTDYYNIKGIAINDPILASDTTQQQIIAVNYTKEWEQLFYFNATFKAQLDERALQCNYTQYLDTYLQYPPPPGPFPELPDPYSDPNYACDMFDTIYAAALLTNPCFNIYHITDQCPYPYSVLGIVNQGDYVPPGAQNYFNRTDVKQAINAPVDADWMQCTDRNVFNYGYVDNYTIGDTSIGPARDGTLQRVIETLNNTIIGSGNLDFILTPIGTLLALQNVSWNGLQGFQAIPAEQNRFLVPYHPEYNPGRMGSAGDVGYWTEERGLVYYVVQLSGHELPGYAATAGYRVLEKLLGRISDLSDPGDFTTQTGNFTGNGTIYRRNALTPSMPLF